MKILVAIDFSEYSDFAVSTSINLAKRLDASITLFHSVDNEGKVNNVKSINQSRLELEKIKSTIDLHGLECDYVLNSGVYITTLADYLDGNPYDFIVVGSHGKSGFSDLIIGSNTQKILRKTKTSVLVVKKPNTENTFKEAAFVTGLNIEDQEALRQLFKYLEKLQIEKLHILSINTLSYFSQPTVVMNSALQDFENISKGYNVQTHFYKDYSVESGVRHFVEEMNIDLVVISNHIKHPIRRIIQGSNVEMIVNGTSCPVLALDYVD